MCFIHVTSFSDLPPGSGLGHLRNHYLVPAVTYQVTTKHGSDAGPRLIYSGGKRLEVDSTCRDWVSRCLTVRSAFLIMPL